MFCFCLIKFLENLNTLNLEEGSWGLDKHIFPSREIKLSAKKEFDTHVIKKKSGLMKHQ